VRYLYLLIGCLMLLLAVPALAQTPSTSQLLKYYQQAKASGMSDMQIEQAAMAHSPWMTSLSCGGA
jgi:hypothetical protein